VSPDELVDAAKGLGLDGICITEHDYFWDLDDIRALSRKHGFLVLPGCEVNTDGGHVLVFGLEKYVFGMHKAAFLRELVEQASGVMVAAHPYRRRYIRDGAKRLDDYRAMINNACRDEFFSFCDAIACVIPVGLLFGRITNFVNGELWGRPTDLPWGVIFPGAGPEPRHPSQLYEAALEGVLLFLVLRFLATRTRLINRPGALSGIFLAGYACSRILVEFVREPDAQLGYLAGPLTMGMLLSLPVLIIGLVLSTRAIHRA